MKLTTENVILVNLIRLQQAFGAGSLKSVKLYTALKEGKMLDKPFDKKCLYEITETKNAEKLLKVTEKSVHKIIDECIKNNITVITPEDGEYPERLRNIADMPLVLYIKGVLPKIDTEPIISIVGPRKISDFGTKASFSLAKRLAKAGFIISSGGALGADTCAHKGALSADGITVAVLGCGICCDYLSENRSLREKITEKGCLISEYPPYTPATKYSFPVRNRIVAALALGTVVVEAGIKSGALITARLANEQGRDVFVIPGNPTYTEYKGSNALLRDGAYPLLDANDIFNQYIASFPDKINIEKAFAEENNLKTCEKNSKKLQLTLSKTAEMVYNNLNSDEFTADDLNVADISDDELISALTELEIEGVIETCPGGSYKLIKH